MNKATRIIPASAGLIVLLVVVVSMITAMGAAPAGATDPANTLHATPVATAPIIDGDSSDAAWASAPTLDVPLSGGWAGAVTMHIKAVYKDSNVYFKVVYSDNEMNTRRKPWAKQEDGSWLHVPVRSAAWDVYNGTSYGWTTPDPSAAYEDKSAIMWNISANGFNEGAGCAVACHWQPGLGGFSDFGRHLTNSATEKVDIWHVKTIRTSPVYSETEDGAGGVWQRGQLDDQNADNCVGTNNPWGFTEDGLPHTVTWANGTTSEVYIDDACNDDWGRHADPKTGGGYSDNQNVDNTLPSHTSPTQPATGSVANPYHIMKSEETPFVDTYAPGDEIAGIRISPIVGDRGDITTGSHYDAVNHTWTIELTRSMNTGSAKDVQFDVNGEYFFGASIFNNNANVQHSTTSGAYKMVFDEPALSLSTTAVYWASFGDYAAGVLSVDYSIANGGPQANGVSITGSVSTNGVTTASSLPVAVGSIPADGSGAATLRYNIPSGVGSFKTSVSASDAEGHTYP